MSSTNVTAVSRKGQHPIDSLFSPDSMPSVWCPGCGIGTIVYTFVQAAEEMKNEFFHSFGMPPPRHRESPPFNRQVPLDEGKRGRDASELGNNSSAYGEFIGKVTDV